MVRAAALMRMSIPTEVKARMLWAFPAEVFGRRLGTSLDCAVWEERLGYRDLPFHRRHKSDCRTFPPCCPHPSRQVCSPDHRSISGPLCRRLRVGHTHVSACWRKGPVLVEGPLSPVPTHSVWLPSAAWFVPRLELSRPTSFAPMQNPRGITQKRMPQKPEGVWNEAPYVSSGTILERRQVYRHGFIRPEKRSRLRENPKADVDVAPLFA